MPFIIAAIIILAGLTALLLYLTRERRRYNSSQYRMITGNSWDEVRSEASHSAEYNIYDTLREYEGRGAKFLFNLYVPMERGGTTELDVIMICSRGIFVFESKSRYGWIEGSDTEREWKQLLFRRDGSLVENKLYNPVMQNRGHVAHLKKLLGGMVPMWSVIVFSDNTDIDRIKVNYSDTLITRESGLKIIVGNLFWNAPEKLTENDVRSIYFKLYQYTCVSDEEKEKHIKDIKNKYLTEKKRPVKKAQTRARPHPVQPNRQRPPGGQYDRKKPQTNIRRS